MTQRLGVVGEGVSTPSSLLPLPQHNRFGFDADYMREGVEGGHFLISAIKKGAGVSLLLLI